MVYLISCVAYQFKVCFVEFHHTMSRFVTLFNPETLVSCPRQRTSWAMLHAVDPLKFLLAHNTWNVMIDIHATNRVHKLPEHDFIHNEWILIDVMEKTVSSTKNIEMLCLTLPEFVLHQQVEYVMRSLCQFMIITNSQSWESYIHSTHHCYNDHTRSSWMSRSAYCQYSALWWHLLFDTDLLLVKISWNRYWYRIGYSTDPELWCNIDIATNRA
jgi:hypothetical protein